MSLNITTNLLDELVEHQFITMQNPAATRSGQLITHYIQDLYESDLIFSLNSERERQGLLFTNSKEETTSQPSNILEFRMNKDTYLELMAKTQNKNLTIEQREKVFQFLKSCSLLLHDTFEFNKIIFTKPPYKDLCREMSLPANLSRHQIRVKMYLLNDKVINLNEHEDNTLVTHLHFTSGYGLYTRVNGNETPLNAEKGSQIVITGKLLEERFNVKALPHYVRFSAPVFNQGQQIIRTSVQTRFYI